MSVRRLVITLLSFAIASPAWAQNPPAGDSAGRKASIDGIAAVVGNQVVLISDVLARVNRMRASGREPRTTQELAKMQREAVDSLIEEELLVQKAQAESIMVNEADVLRSYSDMEQRVRSQFSNEAELRSVLRSGGFQSLEEFRRIRTDEMRRGMMQRDLFMKMRREGRIVTVNVTDKEITEIYEQYKDELPRKPARVGFRQLVIPTRPSEVSKQRAKAKIDSIRVEVAARPGDFESIAKRESMDLANKDLGGDLGWNRRGRMVPEFDRMMFALNPGVISPVVETAFGYHIIRVDRVQPAEVKARHILIRPILDSTDHLRTDSLARAVAAAWRKGANYDSLVTAHHDIANDEEKLIPEFVRDSLPEVYRNALEGHKVNDIIEPFEIDDAANDAKKFVILQVTMVEEAGEYTLAESRDRIREQLSEEHTMRRFIDSLKKGTYVKVHFDPTVAPVKM